MPTYHCECCNFTTLLKGNYKHHLETNKHIINYNLSVKEQKHEMTQNDPQMTHNDPQMTQDEHNKLTIEDDKFECQYCGDIFSTKAHMRRHEIHRCKHRPQESLYEKLQKSEKEKKKLYKQINKLLEKTTITNQRINSDNINNIQNNQNNQNNITLNCYGNEDLSHITESLLDKLIMCPGNMLGKLTEIIHYNNDKPENMNIYIPNKREKYVKIFVKNEWILENKKVKINDILRRNCGILDEHYTLNKDKYTNFSKRNYSIINDGIENENKKILKDQLETIEIGL